MSRRTAVVAVCRLVRVRIERRRLRWRDSWLGSGGNIIQFLERVVRGSSILLILCRERCMCAIHIQRANNIVESRHFIFEEDSVIE